MYWSDIKLLPIWRGLFGFHMMWLDKRDGMVYHFTHKSLPGWHSDLLFRGRVEVVSPDRLRKWIRNNKAIASKF